MIVHVENVKESPPTKELLELRSRCNKVIGHKLDIQKTITFPYASYE